MGILGSTLVKGTGQVLTLGSDETRIHRSCVEEDMGAAAQMRRQQQQAAEVEQRLPMMKQQPECERRERGLSLRRRLD